MPTLPTGERHYKRKALQWECNGRALDETALDEAGARLTSSVLLVSMPLFVCPRYSLARGNTTHHDTGIAKDERGEQYKYTRS